MADSTLLCSDTKQTQVNKYAYVNNYTGLACFGRVVDQRWRSSSAEKDRYQYGYDRDSNRTYRDISWTAGSSGYARVYLHQGGRLDEASGLYPFRYRDYSPILGRWGDGYRWIQLDTVQMTMIYIEVTGTTPR